VRKKEADARKKEVEKRKLIEKQERNKKREEEKKKRIEKKQEEKREKEKRKKELEKRKKEEKEKKERANRTTPKKQMKPSHNPPATTAANLLLEICRAGSNTREQTLRSKRKAASAVDTNKPTKKVVSTRSGRLVHWQPPNKRRHE
jgi:hypothetical protein